MKAARGWRGCPSTTITPHWKWLETRLEGFSGPQWKLQLSLVKDLPPNPSVAPGPPEQFSLKPILKPPAPPEAPSPS